MTNPQRLLKSLLSALVDEWGYKQVELALTQLVAEAGSGERGAADFAKRPKTSKTSKLRAIDQVSRANVPEPQARLLEGLARRFDERRFLPSQSDVREFLLLLGERHAPIKDRSDSFRVILRKLLTLSLEHLDQLANSALHSGPSQLGPLSDAISAAASSLPRHREPPPVPADDRGIEVSSTDTSQPVKGVALPSARGEEKA
jgi:hypothetical protein